MSDVTRILKSVEDGDPTAAGDLLPLVYDELRRLAAARMAQEKPGQTLQATALVHDAYLRLVDVDKAQHWDSRGHFFSAAAEAMRRILIEHVRHKSTDKAGGNLQRIALDDVAVSIAHSPEDLLSLDEALTKLSHDNQPAAELAQQRLFAGQTVEEAAKNMGVPRRTGFRLWSYARAFLQIELREGAN